MTMGKMFAKSMKGKVNKKMSKFTREEVQDKKALLPKMFKIIDQLPEKEGEAVLPLKVEG